MKRILIGLVASLALSQTALAHVVVKPDTVGVAAFQTYTVGVPNEKDNPVVKLRLVIPEGLDSVMPTAKPGWSVTTKKTGDGDAARVTEIEWSGGSVPTEQRDDFSFSGQAPAKPTTLAWKAYQTYQDGSVDAWENPPKANATDAEMDAAKPYSETKVIKDLAATAKTKTDRGALYLSLAAIVIAVLAWFRPGVSARPAAK